MNFFSIYLYQQIVSFNIDRTVKERIHSFHLDFIKFQEMRFVILYTLLLINKFCIRFNKIIYQYSILFLYACCNFLPSSYFFNSIKIRIYLKNPRSIRNYYVAINYSSILNGPILSNIFQERTFHRPPWFPRAGVSRRTK